MAHRVSSFMRWMSVRSIITSGHLGSFVYWYIGWPGKFGWKRNVEKVQPGMILSKTKDRKVENVQ